MITKPRRRSPFRVGVAIACSWLAISSVVWSAPLASGRVALLDSPESSPLVQHCLTRIREELTSGGFAVSVVDPGPRKDPVSIGAALQAQEGAVAAIALVGDPEQPGAELWILDRIGAMPEVRQVPLPAEDAEHLPEVLAIRTMELLKASALKALLEVTRSQREATRLPGGAPVVASATNSKSPPRPEQATHRVGFEAGIAMLESVGGPGPALLPLGGVRAWLGETALARLTLAGLGSRPRIETSIGSASLAQSFGVLEVALALRPGTRFRPTFNLGAGALYVHSDSDGIWPYAGRAQTRWAGALDAGVGLLASLEMHASLAVDVRAVVAFPHPVVRFYDIEAATLAFPAVVASLTMVTWL